MDTDLQKARVSVVMPSFNNSAYLKAAIDSVLQQDHKNLELIVVDDGSTDGSVELLKSYGTRIRLICQENQGPAAARNAGLRQVTGDYVAFQDSDDLWLPGKVTAQVTFLQQHSNYVACYSQWKVWDGEEMRADLLATETETAPTLESAGSGWLYLPLLKVSLLHTITVMIRREVVEQVGFFREDFRIGEDHQYWLRLARSGRIAKLNRVFALYRFNPGSITHKLHPRNYSLEVLQWALSQYGANCPSGQSLPLNVINAYLGERHFNYGYHCLLSGRRDLAAVAFCHSYRLGFMRARSWIYLVICSSTLTYRLFQATERLSQGHHRPHSSGRARRVSLPHD